MSQPRFFPTFQPHTPRVPLRILRIRGELRAQKTIGGFHKWDHEGLEKLHRYGELVLPLPTSVVGIGVAIFSETIGEGLAPHSSRSHANHSDPCSWVSQTLCSILKCVQRGSKRLANGTSMTQDPCILHPPLLSRSRRYANECGWAARRKCSGSRDPTPIMGFGPTVRDSTKRKFGGADQSAGTPRHASFLSRANHQAPPSHLGVTDDHHRLRRGSSGEIREVCGFLCCWLSSSYAELVEDDSDRWRCQRIRGCNWLLSSI